MVSGNRAELLKQLYQELKKQIRPTVIMERNVLESFLFGTCLEDAGFEAAETAFVALKESLSGWNEVRVSSPTELAEMMPQLPDPRGVAVRVKKVLNAIFEERYTFDLEDLRKMNLGTAFTKLEAIPGGTPFSTAYTAQASLGRHGIPVGNGEKKLLYVLGIISAQELEKREITGLNRSITKQQGREFMVLLHTLAAEFVLNPYGRKITEFLKSFAPDYKDRLVPRRAVKEENLQETPPLPVVRGSRTYSKKELAEYLKKEILEEDAQLDQSEVLTETAESSENLESEENGEGKKKPGRRGRRSHKKSERENIVEVSEEMTPEVPVKTRRKRRTKKEISSTEYEPEVSEKTSLDVLDQEEKIRKPRKRKSEKEDVSGKQSAEKEQEASPLKKEMITKTRKPEENITDPVKIPEKKTRKKRVSQAEKEEKSTENVSSEKKVVKKKNAEKKVFEEIQERDSGMMRESKKSGGEGRQKKAAKESFAKKDVAKKSVLQKSGEIKPRKTKTERETEGKKSDLSGKKTGRGKKESEKPSVTVKPEKKTKTVKEVKKTGVTVKKEVVSGSKLKTVKKKSKKK
ncbi:MAG: hypothetical protein Q4C96_02090 [Planctomycetia bacterium]|nr:hypothetical protein [Planctomycetia bacterium]